MFLYYFSCVSGSYLAQKISEIVTKCRRGMDNRVVARCRLTASIASDLSLKIAVISCGEFFMIIVVRHALK